MALAPLVPGFTRFSGETQTTKPSGLVLEGGNGTSYYFWFDNNGSLRTADAATAEAAAFNWQTGGTIVGGGTASGITAIPDLGGSIGGTANDTMQATATVVTLTDSTGLSGTHDDTLAATTVPADLTGGESPTEAEHNSLLAVTRVIAQNVSDVGQKVIELAADNAVQQNNFADLQTKVNAILAALRTAGVIAT
jgi:hypothetical protein